MMNVVVLSINMPRVVFLYCYAEHQFAKCHHNVAEINFFIIKRVYPNKSSLLLKIDLQEAQTLQLS